MDVPAIRTTVNRIERAEAKAAGAFVRPGKQA